MWIAESDATLVNPARALPWGVTERDQWIVVSISSGTLVAYRGSRAVYATLISPGAGGIPRRGQDPVKQSTTPLGIYRITFKLRDTTMSPEHGEHRKFWIADVPHTQYFNAPFALHAAYWHDAFGEPMSAGCINLSPIDAEWLFAWTEPRVPPEWNGAAPSELTGRGTFVVVVR
jgi:lipoprotein-anchoring transpeptidase ErfK/SrfK